MNNKTLLTLYRTHKNNIEEIKWFRNGFQYSLMMKARADALKLNWRNHGDPSNMICKLCNTHNETLEHFLIDCNVLQTVRNKHTILQRPIIENKETLISKILLLDLDEDNIQYYLSIITQLWTTRNQLLNNFNPNSNRLNNSLRLVNKIQNIT